MVHDDDGDGDGSANDDDNVLFFYFPKSIVRCTVVVGGSTCVLVTPYTHRGSL